eukprot:TRINITY_DN4957_c0_g1_i2.p1 TRINITY_DN4957_c0_g1~~TRINITY_DN4957_c0_g1_i2.p1  ORF type:complete len:235 (-),score=45.67 TRINITY_DN4957_c0_g1_i2:280-984(-)
MTLIGQLSIIIPLLAVSIGVYFVYQRETQDLLIDVPNIVEDPLALSRANINKNQTLEDIIFQTEELILRFDLQNLTQENGYSGEKNAAGQKHGIGKLVLSSGIHIGQWKKDQRHGLGRTVSQEGDVYIGEWRFDSQHGKGRLIASDGSRYEGDWKVGSFDGNGTFWNTDGSRYQGQWQSGQMHGSGVWQSETQLHQGVWVNGLREGRFMVSNKADGKILYRGLYKEDRPVRYAT